MSARRKLVVGNWKMNGSRAGNAELLAGLKAAGPFVAEVAVCPPFPYLAEVALALQGEDILWGAQDCSSKENGAYTGDVSPAMLAEYGCRYVIVGHSERRRDCMARAISWWPIRPSSLSHIGSTPIVCVGVDARRARGRADGRGGEAARCRR